VWWKKSIATGKQKETGGYYIESDEKPLGEIPENRRHV